MNQNGPPGSPQQALGGAPQFGSPQPPPGAARFFAFARSLTVSTIGLGVIVFGLEAGMPSGSKPSEFIGRFHGNTHLTQLDAERQGVVNTARGVGYANAEGPAAWQMETVLAQIEMQRRAEAMQAQVDIANGADYVCMGGAIVSALFGKDGKELSQAMSQACGVGDLVRGNVNRQIVDAARQGSGLLQRPTVPASGRAP